MITKEGIIDMIWKDKEYKLACRNIAKGDELYKDMFQELIIILCQYDETKLIAVYNRGEIKYFIVAIISRMWHSPRHPFYKLYREPYIEFKEKHMPPVLDNIPNENEEEEHRLQIIKAGQDVKRQLEQWKGSSNSGEWYKGTLFEKYIEEGSYRKLSKVTGIPRKSLAETNKKTIEEIKQILKPKK